MMDALRPETEVHYFPKFNWHPRDVDIFNIDESGNVDDINNQRYSGDVDNPSGNVDGYN